MKWLVRLTGTVEGQASAYFLFDLIAKGAAFWVAIGLAYFLDPVDYGYWALLHSISILLSLFLGSGFGSAAGRWYFEESHTNFRRSIFTLWVSQIAVILILAVVLEFVGARYLQNGPALVSYGPHGRIIFLAAAFASLTAIPVAVLISHRAVKAAGSLSALSALIPSGAMLVSVLFSPHLIGVLYGMLIGQIIVGSYGCLITWRMCTPRLSGELFRMMVFGLPLVPHLVAHWFLGSVDRYMLDQELGPESVAIYHIAYMAGFVVLMIGQAFSKSWMPEYLKESNQIGVGNRYSMNNALISEEMLRKKATRIVMSVVFLGALVAFWGEFLLKSVVPMQFEAGLHDVSIIVAGNIFAALYMVPVSVLFLFKKTLIVASITMFCAMTNVLLNAVLIPEYGTTGAALATLFSYLLLFLLVFLFASKFRSIPIDRSTWVRVGVALILVLYYAIAANYEFTISNKYAVSFILTALLFITFRPELGSRFK